MADIYLEYSRRDQEFVEQLYKVLTEANISVWYDRINIELGTHWPTAITEAIRDCKVFLLVLSPHAATADSVRRGVDLALRYRKTILPLIWSATEIPTDLEYQLAGTQWIEFRQESSEENFKKLIARLNILLGNYTQTNDVTYDSSLITPSALLDEISYPIEKQQDTDPNNGKFGSSLRQREPGYDRIYELVQKFNQIPPDKRSQISKNTLESFIGPMFAVLGWNVLTETALQDSQRLFDLELTYNTLRIPVEIKMIGEPLNIGSSDVLRTWRGEARWGILTNFEKIQIWDIEQQSLVLETSPESYITDKNQEHDLLAANIFYDRFARPQPKSALANQPSASQSTVTPVTVDPYQEKNFPSPSAQTNLGELLRRYRHKVGLTQEQLASMLGVARNTISQWENNRSQPGPEYIDNLVSALQLSDHQKQSLLDNLDISTAQSQSQELDSSPQLVKPEQIDEALKQARAIANPQERARALAVLVPNLPQPQQFEVIDETLQLIRTISDVNIRSEILSDIYPLLLKLVPIFGSITDAFPQIRGRLATSQTLTELVKQYTAAGLYDEALKVAREIPFDGTRSRALAELAPNLHEPLQNQVFQEAIESARNIQHQESRIKELLNLIPVLPVPLQEAVGKELREIASTTENEKLLAQIEAAIQAEEPPKPEAAPEFVEPYNTTNGPRQRFEEIMAGISFGNNQSASATITALVTDRATGEARLLLPGGLFREGNTIFQPFVPEGGSNRDKIGEITREIYNVNCTATLAHLSGERKFISILPNKQPVGEVAEIQSGLKICKFGAASGYTEGTIFETGITRTITYSPEQQLELRNLFSIQPKDFSQPGDLGALVVTPDHNQPVGVIVSQGDETTYCLPIQTILDQLNIDLIKEQRKYERKHQVKDQVTALNDLVGGQDRLGFKQYVDAFERLVKDKETQPPLTIGIYGAWGTGKSFLMDKVARRLGYKPEQEQKKGEKRSLWDRLPSPRLQNSDVVAVWFEAWDYNGTDKLWAGLVERIYQTLEKEMGWQGQIIFNLQRNLRRQWRQIRAKLLPYTLITIVIVSLFIGFLWSGQGQWAATIGGVSFVAILVSQLIELFSTPASQRIVDLFATADYKQDIGFMGRIREDLEDFVENLPDRGDQKMKVVVFIDDLDRCDPEKAVEVLEAIKLLLDLDRFIVFLAIDARVITQAVEEHYGKVLSEAQITGYEYLNKIVQIPFSIPEPQPQELRNYMASLVGLAEADIPPFEPKPMFPPPQVFGVVAESEPPPVPAPGRLTPITSPPPADHPQSPVDEPTSMPPDQPETPSTPESKPERVTEVEVKELPFETLDDAFTPDEQKEFLAFYTHLHPNPRRLKRLVNIYRLVRVLIKSQELILATGKSSGPLKLPTNHQQIMAWLILCEQWPYAAHTMLEVVDQNLKQAMANPTSTKLKLDQAKLLELHQAAQQRIIVEGHEDLKKLDLKYEQLEDFIKTHLNDFSLADLQILRPFTVNFNPALSAEVRLTLSNAAG